MFVRSLTLERLTWKKDAILPFAVYTAYLNAPFWVFLLSKLEFQYSTIHFSLKIQRIKAYFVPTFFGQNQYNCLSLSLSL